ncbi:phosphoenolpyruvate synthase [Tersicoccus solisilvae]|uniref:Phosphoenolpyruvate synthase n=1 Tax=Tersicoccus solisilvae TaxID=1882339 RepID=A0ABQ1NRC4_9MICC|nr:PEP/pyruvate-binding domain-containing protein [Tersicoccus solisilvae]GGC78165.1 phosphoenolpyruvate synthase [Tersicoccus solisilvae]
MRSTDYVQFFDGGIEPQLSLLGGKGASLVTMTAAGMPVPPGFVVTTAQYDAFLTAAGIAAEIESLLAGLDADDIAQVDAVSARIRDHITSRPVPEHIRDQTRDAYTDLMARFDAPVPVAVRSSATAEDLPDASFAGQQDTYLWLSGFDAVAEHIRACWSSLYTSRAILYRLKNGIPDEGLSMAVVVQKMVNSRVSGVAITMDPANGDRSKITIDASWGVGEMVVSGQVTPDNVVVDKVTLALVREHLGDKHAELVPDADAGALVERDVEPERRERRCLTDAELAAVATLAKRAEKHYRCPQDVEWALDADLPAGEDLLLLQARPETVHSSRPREAAPATAKPATGGFDLGSITASLTTVPRPPA